VKGRKERSRMAVDLFAKEFGDDENEDGATEATTEEKIDHRIAGGGDG